MTYLVILFLAGAVELLIRRPRTLQQRAVWLQQFSKRLLRAMDVKVVAEGPVPTTGVIASNHIGYLDIVALGAQRPCVFVARAELAHIPVVGFMATMAGTVYVERGRGGSALKARDSIVSALDANIPVVIFPEGTTTDGTTMLPFRSGALGQAMEAGSTVTATHIHYQLNRPNPPGATIRNNVAFHGDAQLFTHIYHLLALHGVQVNIRFAPQPIEFPPGPVPRKLAATESRAAIMRLGNLTEPATP